MKISILKPYCYSAQGGKPNQEDSLFPPQDAATEQTRVFMVCDGMGGHEHGEVASASVAETIGSMTARQPLCSTSEMQGCFEEALQQAYLNLDELDHTDSLRKMGTTLTFLAICTDGVLVAHIGDSRVYQLRPGKGVIFQTRDHSLVNDLIAAGEISEEQARTHPRRNIITRAIQPHQEYPAKAAYTILRDIKKGDILFLCCDGVVEQLDNNDLCNYLLNEKPLEERLSAVRDACAARDTRDNNTAYLIEVAEAECEEGSDEEVLLHIAEDVTKPVPVPSKCDWAKNRRLWIGVAIFVAVAILLCTLLSSSSNAKKDGRQDPPKSGQTLAPIHRNR